MSNQRKDDALAPIVAFLLLLMIVVSFISLLNAYYIPSLKQQAEVEHLNEVEESFQLISGDILRLISINQDSMLQERIPLGGGDVMFSPVKSSGTIQIDENSLYTLVYKSGSDTNYKALFKSNITNITYHPIGNFWINQGYFWKNGTVNITKGSKSTWLEYIDKKAADNETKMLFKALLPDFSENLTGNFSITAYNLTKGDNSFKSGNGIETLTFKLIADESFSVDNVTKISIVNTLPGGSSILDEEINKLIKSRGGTSNEIGYEKPVNITVIPYSLEVNLK